jgi:hypothetical protein
MAILIHNVTELQNVRYNLTGDYELANDIECGGVEFEPIGILAPYYFSGTLDGKCHKIKNLTITIGTSRGNALFLDLADTGEISNVNIVDCFISVTSAGNVAALVGGNQGIISKCSSTGTVINYGGFAGGLVGGNSNYTTSVISNCYSRCTVRSMAGGGFIVVGGFIAGNHGTIINCYSTGVVSSAVPSIYVGGFCGLNDGPPGTITNCFWDLDTSGQATSSGGTGEHTAWMTTESNFVSAGWDFTTPIWYISPSDNDGYPNLGLPVVIPIVLPSVSTEAATGVQ